MTDFDHSDTREAEIARQLLGSARLDVPEEDARSRTLEAGLGVIASRSKPWRALATGGSILALGLGAWAISVSSSGSRPMPPDLRPEEAGPPPPVVSAFTNPLRPCPEVVVARGTDPLIDDWEENDFGLLARDNRSGEWAAFDDGSAKGRSLAGARLLPSAIPGRRGSSRRALHIFGAKLANWGVTVGSNLASGACYDATARRHRVLGKRDGLLHRPPSNDRRVGAQNRRVLYDGLLQYTWQTHPPERRLAACHRALGGVRPVQPKWQNGFRRAPHSLDRIPDPRGEHAVRSLVRRPFLSTALSGPLRGHVNGPGTSSS